MPHSGCAAERLRTSATRSACFGLKSKPMRFYSPVRLVNCQFGPMRDTSSPTAVIGEASAATGEGAPVVSDAVKTASAAAGEAAAGSGGTPPPTCTHPLFLPIVLLAAIVSVTSHLHLNQTSNPIGSCSNLKFKDFPKISVFAPKWPPNGFGSEGCLWEGAADSQTGERDTHKGSGVRHRRLVAFRLCSASVGFAFARQSWCRLVWREAPRAQRGRAGGTRGS